jgi:TolB-like protein/class 3 adenylate cyclase
MTAEDFKRKLTTILHADVKGYSRLMGEDEEATVSTLTAYRKVIGVLIRKHRGRVVHGSGDSLLAEFISVVDAVQCAVEIQKELKTRNAELSEDRKVEFRIGINLGDVIDKDEDLHGDGVNIAARIEGLAEGGGICISEFVYTQVYKQLDLNYIDIGRKTLKNIPNPVRVYRVIRKEAERQPQEIEITTDQETSLSLPEKPSLAVLPFANLNADSKQDYFSDGLTIDIMTALVTIPGLFLISEISMFSYKSKPISIRELSHQLGVSHVLDGGVRREGDRVRITARLIEASSGRHIWAKRFDRKIDDIFMVQDEITEEIVTAMDIKLVSGESARSIRKTIRNPDALECFYRGWEALFGTTKEDIKEAQEMFEETMRLEPESSIGYALAAWAHWWAVDQGLSDDIPFSLTRAAELAQNALGLEDFTGLPHLVMAQIHLFKREHDKALEEAEKAVIARPSCDLSYVAKANILNYLGRPTDAIDLVKFAIRLAPVYPPFFPEILANAYYGSGKYEEAIATAKEVLKKDRNNLGALIALAAANAELDRLEEALTAASEIRRINSDFTLENYSKTQPYKDPETLQQLISILQMAGLQ